MIVLRCDTCNKVDEGEGIFAAISAVTVGEESPTAQIYEGRIHTCEECLGPEIAAVLKSHMRARDLVTETTQSDMLGGGR